jgi:hypothetical protein
MSERLMEHVSMIALGLTVLVVATIGLLLLAVLLVGPFFLACALGSPWYYGLYFVTVNLLAWGIGFMMIKAG